MANDEEKGEEKTRFQKYYEENVKGNHLKMQERREKARDYWKENPEKYEEHKRRMREKARKQREALKKLEGEG